MTVPSPNIQAALDQALASVQIKTVEVSSAPHPNSPDGRWLTKTQVRACVGMTEWENLLRAIRGVL